MKHSVFAVRDTCMESFMVPMFFRNHGSAIRALTDAVNKADGDNQFYQHPEHFQLYHLGEFDDETGLFSSFPPVFVCDCQSLCKSVGPSA